MMANPYTLNLAPSPWASGPLPTNLSALTPPPLPTARPPVSFSIPPFTGGSATNAGGPAPPVFQPTGTPSGITSDQLRALLASLPQQGTQQGAQGGGHWSTPGQPAPPAAAPSGITAAQLSALLASLPQQGGGSWRAGQGDTGGPGNANAGMQGSAGTGPGKAAVDALMGLAMGALGPAGSLMGLIGQRAAGTPSIASQILGALGLGGGSGSGLGGPGGWGSDLGAGANLGAGGPAGGSGSIGPSGDVGGAVGANVGY